MKTLIINKQGLWLHYQGEVCKRDLTKKQFIDILVSMTTNMSLLEYEFICSTIEMFEDMSGETMYISPKANTLRVIIDTSNGIFYRGTLLGWISKIRRYNTLMKIQSLLKFIGVLLIIGFIVWYLR